MPLKKALKYLVVGTGLGYILTFIATNDDISKLDFEVPEKSNKIITQKEGIVNILKGAAQTDVPLYRMNKDELESLRSKLTKEK